ncbi:MAG: helix-turn-helix transcriptional regulator [Clostridia bacterium]|nr:helix-turn-helix transcriptional regulator [Clostridia bacterium]
MEKKTIGKFISALRRANGMTQRELGEKLYVSDKTVSRWECDECEPELSLIPLIAEIFDITADELLRGERNGNKGNENECGDKLSIKSEKQFKLMLHNSKKKYDNLSLIYIGIIIVGIIVAIICNIGFNRGLLGFCLGSIFFIAGIICQVCFTVNSRFLIDEDEVQHIDAMKKANTDRVFKCVHIIFFVAELLAFCLPIAIMPPYSNWGLNFESWILYGLLFSVIGLIIYFLVYRLIIFKMLVNKEIIFLDEKENERIKAENGLLKKVFVVFAIIFIVLLIASYIINVVFDASSFIKKERFDNPDDFIEYVQKDYDEWFKEGYGDIPEIDIDKDYTYAKYFGEIDGKEYYYNPDLYHNIFIDEYENGKFEIVVTTKQAYYDGHDIFDLINGCLLIMQAISFVVCVGWYCIGVYRKRINV